MACRWVNSYSQLTTLIEELAIQLRVNINKRFDFKKQQQTKQKQPRTTQTEEVLSVSIVTKDTITVSNPLWAKNRGTQRQFSEKYLFGGRFEIYNFRNICCEISCLPASPRIFEHLINGKIAHFQRILTLKRSPRIFGSLFSGWNFRKGKFWSL